MHGKTNSFTCHFATTERTKHDPGIQQHKTNPGSKIEEYFFLKPAASASHEDNVPKFRGKICKQNPNKEIRNHHIDEYVMPTHPQIHCQV